MARGAIFDVDGTLVDSVDLHAQAWQEAFRHFGVEVAYPLVREQIGKGGDQLMPALLPADLLARQGPEIDAYRGELFKRDYLPRVKAFPKVRELFERIVAAKFEIALASSAKRGDLEAYERIAGIGDLLGGSASSDDAERSKPHPDIFEAALDKLGIRAVDAIAVGDTPYDAEAAGKAKIRTIGLLTGGWSAEKLRAAGCVAIYADPAELFREFDRSPFAAQ